MGTCSLVVHIVSTVLRGSLKSPSLKRCEGSMLTCRSFAAISVSIVGQTSDEHASQTVTYTRAITCKSIPCLGFLWSPPNSWLHQANPFLWM